MLVFVEGGKPENAEKNPREARREPTTNSTHIWHWAGIEPRPHWREVSALTTAPSLLSLVSFVHPCFLYHVFCSRPELHM